MRPGLLASGEFIPPLHSTVRARTRFHLVAYGLFATTLFCAMVTATFPYAETISSILSPIGLKVVFQRQAIVFPIGARLENAKLVSAANEEPLMQSPKITIAPIMRRLLIGQLCLNVRAQLFGGLVDATVRRLAPRGAIVDFQLKSLDIARISNEGGDMIFPARARESEVRDSPYNLKGILSGELSGSGSAQITGPDIMVTRASLILLGHDVKAMLATGLPPLELGVVWGGVLFDQDIVTLKNLRGYGRYGELAANGEIHLASDVASSTLQLTLGLKPTANARTAFGLLLNMLPHSPGTGPYYLEGPLKFPVVS